MDLPFLNANHITSNIRELYLNSSFGITINYLKQAVDENSVYDLASSSKAAGTLLAVMKAYDDKKFTLNNKISDFIPELKDSDKKNLAVKDLLYHQSGLTPTINFYLNAIDKDSYKGSLYSNAKNQAHPVRFDARTYVRNDFSFLPIWYLPGKSRALRQRSPVTCICTTLLKTPLSRRSRTRASACGASTNTVASISSC